MIHEDHRHLEGSPPDREFLHERAEILRHKWLESERAGQDIGFDKALLGWLINHRNAWRASGQTPAAY
jgi:hypothetical protein